jgi:RNA polymerase sigma factor for flagellar operon FliA
MISTSALCATRDASTTRAEGEVCSRMSPPPKTTPEEEPASADLPKRPAPKKKKKKKKKSAKAGTGEQAKQADPAAAGDKADKPKPATKAMPKLGPDGKVDQKALIDQYLPYVRSIAGKIKKSLAKEIEFDDLVEYGMVGLLEAAGRFDPRYGANFMTFSYYRIRGAIYDGLRNMGWVSRNEYARYRFEERANTYLGNLADRQAGSVGDENKTVEDEVNELADTVQSLVTIFVTSLEGMEGLQVEDVDAAPIDITVGDAQMKRYVREALSRLPEQERNLLTMYYFKEMSLQEVGDALGLSKSWTSRLHAKAVEKLSRILRELLREHET